MTTLLPIRCKDGYTISTKKNIKEHLLINRFFEPYESWWIENKAFYHFILGEDHNIKVNLIQALFDRHEYIQERIQNGKHDEGEFQYLYSNYPEMILGILETIPVPNENIAIMIFQKLISQFDKKKVENNMSSPDIFDYLDRKFSNSKLSDSLREAAEKYFDLYNKYVKPTENRKYPLIWHSLSNLLGINDNAEIFRTFTQPETEDAPVKAYYHKGMPLFEGSPYETAYEWHDNTLRSFKEEVSENWKSFDCMKEVAKQDKVYQKNIAMLLMHKMVWYTLKGNWQYDLTEFINAYTRKKLPYTENEMISVLRCMYHDMIPMHYISGLSFFKNVESHVKQNGLSPQLQEALELLLQWKCKYSEPKTFSKLRVRIQEVLATNGQVSIEFQPVLLDEGDEFGRFVNHQIALLAPEEAQNWYNLFSHCRKATTGKPSKKFLKESKKMVETIEPQFYVHKMGEWLTFLKEMDTSKEGYYSQYLLRPTNQDTAKGLIWSLSHFLDPVIMPKLHQLTLRCYEKISGVGPRAAALGNACIFAFANGGTLESINYLTRIKSKVRNKSIVKVIDKYIKNASLELGVTEAMLEDMAVQEYDLTDGRVLYQFDDYGLEIQIERIGKVKMQWYKPDGTPQKSVPSFVKKNHAARLKSIKAQVKNISQNLTTQRNRLDRSYIQDRRWTYSDFKKYYLNHGLMSFLAKRLIWIFENDDETITAFWRDGWKTVNGIDVNWMDDNTTVKLWHPVFSEIPEIEQWRNFMQKHEVVQPMKQAFREVYLLTDAELNTRTYSNRMAAHILKQHQFNQLAKLRGWSYSLIGGWDGGYDEHCQISLPAFELSAEYWITHLPNDDHFTDSGIYMYVGTDQVRFHKNRSAEPLPLIDVPKIVFSEIMRDVDMFVGVGSVGNDPEWQDNGGMPQYRDYWTSYSFGDLTEVAKTRKTILERLLPKLKIAKVAEIDGKFLKVKGTYTTYKIHIGSTNILMEPNDQYLCIVPSGKKDKNTESVFLPFEGDRGFSILLSKAFLLADDHKITDRTIISQLPK